MTKIWGFARAAQVLSMLICGVEALHVDYRSPDSSEALTHNVYEIHYGACTCDLRELECLPSVECFEVMLASSDQLVTSGVQVRRGFKAKYLNGHLQGGSASGRIKLSEADPLGKVVTYGAIFNWNRWVAGMDMALSWSDRTYFRYVDTSRYSQCQEKSLVGAPCFWNDFTDLEDTGEIEQEALKREGTRRFSPRITREFAKLEDFRVNVSLSVNGSEAQQKEVLSYLSADDYLLSLAHIARIQFNMKQHMKDAYNSHTSVVNPGIGRLRVGLHIRRADSCSHLNKDGYMKEPSTLDTHAQMTNVRLCYHTKVYIKMLRRIRNHTRMPLAVYLSSDDAGSILDEIKHRAPDLFRWNSWHYLNFTRNQFKYVGTIEYQDHKEAGFLGETGTLDAWHLSHGQMFVGSFGSRFGKAAYLLAAARHNSPIPYISVDGHNYCCQNDEQCSKAVDHLTGIVDCLTFAPQLWGYAPNLNQTGYWFEGVTVRWDRPASERELPWGKAWERWGS